MTTQELDLGDLTPLEFSFEYQGKSYILKEAIGEAAIQYQNKMAKCVKRRPNGTMSFEGLADLQPYLISLCLFEGPSGVNVVSERTIRLWPSRLQKKLYDKVREISDLEEEGGGRGLLIKALEGENSPIEYEELLKYVMSLPSEFDRLKKWIKDPQSLAKNALGLGVAGSG